MKERIKYDDFKSRCGERISHYVENQNLGPMGATIIEHWWSTNADEILISETSNGGFSHYSVNKATSNSN